MRKLVHLNTPNSDGITKRQSLERSIRKVKDDNPAWAARMEKELESVDVPTQVVHLLVLFDQLNSKRRHQFITSLAGAINVPEPISSLELESHLRLHQRRLTPWEVETLEQMDLVYREESMKLQG